jgi:hypothetical protein
MDDPRRDCAPERMPNEAMAADYRRGSDRLIATLHKPSL